MNKMINYVKKSKMAIMGLMATVGAGILSVGNSVYAAADESLTAAITQTTTFFTDNLGEISTFVIDIILKFAIVAVSIAAAYFVYRKLRGIFKKA